MYNLTLRRGHLTTVAAEKQNILHILSVCVCSLSCPACTAHAPTVICDPPGSTIFLHTIS